MPPALTDRELGDALIAQALWAPKAAWQRFAPMVRHLVVRHLGPADLEDVMQEIFCTFFRVIAELRDPAAVRSFLVAVAIRGVATESRRRRRRARFAPQADPLERCHATADVGAAHALSRFIEVLRRLREHDRRAFVLRFVEGRTNEEVALCTHVSGPTARRRYTRAVARVRFHAQRDLFLYDYAGAHPAATPENGA